MRVIYDGDVKLLAKEYAKLHKSEDPFTGKMEYTFFSETDYFIRTSNGSFHQVKLKDKDILKALGDHQDELKQYAKSNDLDFDREDDLTKILIHYNATKSQ